MDDLHDLDTAMEMVRKTADQASTESIRVKQAVATF
jgi:hypothetical protein